MRVLLAVAVCAALTGSSAADEGLWTFEDFPSEKVAAAHGFAPDRAWLDRLRAATLSIGGCSASIVGSSGLVMTNHHCVSDCIGDLAGDGQDTEFEAVIARSRADERICPGMEAYAVVDVTDVTERVGKAREGLSPAEAHAAAEREYETIVAECEANDPGRSCEVARLYGGGRPTLYAYRKWTDVRMVLGPETAAGSFGGDPDNFNFPRYAWDAAFLRLYENGEPARTPERLRLRQTPPADGELLFVSGFPGETGREASVASVEYYVDTFYPWALTTDAELRGRLISALAQPGGAARGLDSVLFGVENAYKRNWTELMSLRSPGFMDRLRAREAQLRADIAARPDVAAMVGDAYAQIEQALETSRVLFYPRRYIEEAGGGSALAAYARTIVRAAFERERPAGERLPGYSDSSLASMREGLETQTPFYRERDVFLLGYWLSKMREHLTVDHPVVKLALGKESPEGLSRRAIGESRLDAAAERLRLFDGGIAAVKASEDPLIRLFAAIEPAAREIALRNNEEIQAPLQDAQQRINSARFELYGSTTYPDATSTLRLNPGVVSGWTEPDGRRIDPFTRFAGLGERATDASPFKLAPAWEAALPALNPDTVFNFATDNDTIGGNSGSPIVDREMQVVGAMFDGNIHSNGGYYLYDETLNRTVGVAAPAILEALAKVYGLDHIVGELLAE